MSLSTILPPGSVVCGTKSCCRRQMLDFKKLCVEMPALDFAAGLFRAFSCFSCFFMLCSFFVHAVSCCFILSHTFACFFMLFHTFSCFCRAFSCSFMPRCDNNRFQRGCKYMQICQTFFDEGTNRFPNLCKYGFYKMAVWAYLHIFANMAAR